LPDLSEAGEQREADAPMLILSLESDLLDFCLFLLVDRSRSFSPGPLFERESCLDLSARSMPSACFRPTDERKSVRPAIATIAGEPDVLPQEDALLLVDVPQAPTDESCLPELDR
jgi:hypothetical protein